MLTTHYMDEAQALADRLAVISAGQVVAEGTPATIGGRDQARARIRFELPDGCHPADLPLDAALTGDGPGHHRDRGADGGAARSHRVGTAPGRGAGRAHRGPAQPGRRLPAPHRRDRAERKGARDGHRHPPSPPAPAARYHSPALRHDAALAWHQVRYEQLSFWRNPQSAFFTFVFPVVIIVLFGGLFRCAGRSSYFYGLSVAAVLRAHDRGDVRAGLVLQPARHRAGHPAAGGHPQAGPGHARCPPGATSSACWRTASWSASWTSR